MKKSAQFHVEVPVEQVASALIQGLPSLGFKVDHVDPSAGRISASSGFSLRTYGSKLELVATATGPASTTVKVESRSTWPLQATDWGKTKSDLAKIGRLVQSGRTDA